MSDLDLTLIGDDELLAAFRELGFKTQHKRLHQVMSHAGNIPKKAMREVIPVRKTKTNESGKKWHPPGTGRKSITKKRGRSKKTATLFIGPRVRTGNYHTDAFYLKFWEFYRPGARRVTAAAERSLPLAQRNIFNSMRVIIIRAWNKNVKK